MAGVLELPKLSQHDRPSERHLAGGRIEAELDAKRPAERELVLETPIGNDLCGSGEERIEV